MWYKQWVCLTYIYIILSSWLFAHDQFSKKCGLSECQGTVSRNSSSWEIAWQASRRKQPEKKPNWGNYLTFAPSFPVQKRGPKFCQHVPLWGPLEKKFQRPSSPNRGDMRGQRKNFPSRPLKILWRIRPKFCPWPALDVPYKWPKFGARNGHSFSSKEKMWVERMPGYCFQEFLKLGNSLTLLWQELLSL